MVLAGVSVAYLAFGDGDIKSRVERFLSSITNAIEIVLGRNVEVRIILLPDGEASINSESWNDLPKDLKQTQTAEAIERERKAICSNANGNYSDLDSQLMPCKLSRGSFNELEGKIKGSEDCSNCSPFRAGAFQSTGGSLKLLAEGNSELGGTKERRLEIPMHIIESIIREQRLETAWLQAAEKGTTESLSHSRPEKNQVLPQEGIYIQNHIESILSSGLPSKQWEDQLNQELRALKLEDERVLQKDQNGKRGDHYPMSPSLLHESNFMGNFSKESL